MFKKFLCTLAAVCAAAAVCGAEPFYLFRSGRSQAVIVLPENASKMLKKNVSAFSVQVKKSTGAPVQLVTKPAAGKNNIVFVCEKRTPDDQDRFSIRFPQKNTLQICGSEIGIGHALEYLLEKAYNVRRLIINYPDFRWKTRPKRFDRALEVSCEPVKTASVARKDVTMSPSFNFKRELWTHSSGWMTRNSFPGIHDMVKWAFPIEKYAPDNSWPQQIMPVIRGKRHKMQKADRKNWWRFKVRWQPCWSNPDSVKIAVENILEQLALEKNKDVYSINLDVNDNGGCCACSKCREALRKSKGRNYSDLYWKWINEIAAQVTKKYPHLYINCLAYREVINPPAFKLHPNVIPQICRELTATQNPAVKKRIEDLLKGWSRKARVIFFWDYQYGASSYLFPRIYFHRQAELFKMLHKYNVRGVFIECGDCIGLEGPKHYLNSRLLWDINTDVDRTVREWCEYFGGKKAAPFLAAYFKFWEDYWQRPEISRTNWFTSSPNTYMQLKEQGSYTYALKKGELAKLRKLLEKAAAAAETPAQKKRMLLLLNDTFAVIEASAKCLFSEYLQADGTVASAADAVALLKSVPEAVRALNRLKKNSVLSVRMQGIAEGGLISNVNAVLPHLKNSAVQKELQKLMSESKLPKALSVQLQIMSGKKYKNLCPDGSFEKKSSVPRGTKPSSKHVSDGKQALLFRNGLFRFTVPGIKAGKTYYIALDVFCGKSSIEGRFNVQAAPCIKTRAVDWKRQTNLKIAKGWQTVSFAYKVAPRYRTVDNFLVLISAVNFETDEPLWIDNVRVYQLD